MFTRGCLTVVVVVVVLIAIPAVAFHYLPVWAALLIAAGEGALVVLAGPKVGGWLVKRFLIGMFVNKSRVLRGATVVVHRVEGTTKPVRPGQRARPQLIDEDGKPAESPASAASPDEDKDDEDDEDRRHYVLVDFTLTPRLAGGPMRFYETSEMMLVPFDAKVSRSEDPTSNDRSASVQEELLIDDSTGTETRDFDKLTGPAHLRMIFACPPTLHGRVKFQYYFETFGDFTIT